MYADEHRSSAPSPPMIWQMHWTSRSTGGRAASGLSPAMRQSSASRNMPGTTPRHPNSSTRLAQAVTAERFQQLLKHSEPLDESDDPSFAFLTKGERSRLEDAIAEKQMQANEANGMNCIARCTVESDSGAVLEFEGDVEDDGACINLRTPYDKRAKRFTDLSRCLTSGW